MQISIFGLGYVGAVSLACLARDGHEVTGVDIDPVKLDLLRNGRSPIVEEGIQELIAQVVASGRVSVTDNAAEAMARTDVSFVCVGTPSAANGSQDITAIERLAAQMGQAVKSLADYHVVVVRSTVKPGTTEDLVLRTIEQESGQPAGHGFDVCFQPEFLREGTSIRDYDNPPFTVVGTPSVRAAARLRELFGALPAEFVHTDIRTAEMLKYACNSFHAVKVTFANEIGRISRGLGVDSHEVMRLVCEDRQLNVSPAYLKPGFAFGGSCLPKDVKALLYAAKMHDVGLPLLEALLPSNRMHIEQAIDRVLRTGRRRIGMIGLSFKSGTDDLRESPLVVLAESFIGKGLDLKIYDPEVNVARLMGANRRYIEESIPHIASLMCDEYEEVFEHAELLVVGLRDAPLMERLPGLVKPGHIVFDLVNIPGREKLAGTYEGVCW